MWLYLFTRFVLNHSIHIDFFYDAFMTFLDLLCFGCLDFQWSNRNLYGFIKKYLFLFVFQRLT